MYLICFLVIFEVSMCSDPLIKYEKKCTKYIKKMVNVNLAVTTSIVVLQREFFSQGNL